MNDKAITGLQINQKGFSKALRNIATNENFLLFLSLCAHNITMSFENQVMLFMQNKFIRNVRGSRTGFANNENVQETALKDTIVLYYRLMEIDEPEADYSPEEYEYSEDYPIESDFRSEYIPVKAVGEIETPICDDENISSKLPDMVSKTGIIIEMVPRTNLRHPANKADYDVEKGIIQVANSLSKKQFGEALIIAFTKICLEADALMDSSLQIATGYVVSEYFGISQKGVHSALFRQIFDYSDKELEEFLRQVSNLSFRVVEALIGTLLTFDETGIVNNYFTAYDAETFGDELECLAAYASESPLVDSKGEELLSGLAYKFSITTEASLNFLSEQISKYGVIYTYPPFRFEKNVDINC